MIGIPITIIIMIFFGYEQMQTAGFSDAMMQTQKAQEQAPNPLASIIQFPLFITSFVLFWKISGQTPGMKMARIEIVDAKSFHEALECLCSDFVFSAQELHKLQSFKNAREVSLYQL